MDAEMDDEHSELEADEAEEAAIAGKAMEEARGEVERLSLEQLLQAPWPAMHGTALFASVARINHSCAPNLKIEFPANSARLTATALNQVTPGDELCISYIRQE